jgi:hypothetical protein
MVRSTLIHTWTEFGGTFIEHKGFALAFLLNEKNKRKKKIEEFGGYNHHDFELHFLNT